jgi:hypothetical protein
MPRLRTLKWEFFSNEVLCSRPPLTRILFEGLWCVADREGRLEDRPRQLRALIFPYEQDCDVDAMLDDLARNGFIRRYEVDGVRYIAVLAFNKHQKPHHKERPSTIPPPPEHLPRSVPAPTQASVSPEKASASPVVFGLLSLDSCLAAAGLPEPSAESPSQEKPAAEQQQHENELGGDAFWAEAAAMAKSLGAPVERKPKELPALYANALRMAGTHGRLIQACGSYLDSDFARRRGGSLRLFLDERVLEFELSRIPMDFPLESEVRHEAH